jgi:hypothetical protein
MLDNEQKLTATVSISMKINLGNYETADAFLSVGGITTETTEKEINDLLDGKTRITYDALKVHLAEKIQQLRKK